ncbi:MAG: YicC/YloC family endoribonuclease [Sandaracinaceae bacterium]
MTGHGVGHAEVDGGRVTVELRAVNHRSLDLRLRLPADWSAHHGALEEALRPRLLRGRVEGQARLAGASGAPDPVPRLDETKARAVLAQLRALRDAECPGEPLPLGLLATVPDLFVPPSRLDEGVLRDALLRAAELACEQLWAMRLREGEALRADLEGHIASLTADLARVEARIPETVEAHRRRLHDRVAELVASAPASALDPGRLELEVALLAERTDVAEEVSRLHSHLAQLEALLSPGPEAEVGKRIDFLLQEVSREVNTLGAKGADAELAQRVIAMKTAVSRMREQAQNVL